MNMAKDDMSCYKEKKNSMTNIEKCIDDINIEVTELESMRSIKERELTQIKEKLIKTQHWYHKRTDSKTIIGSSTKRLRLYVKVQE